MIRFGIYLVATIYGLVIGSAAVLCVAMIFGQSVAGLEGWGAAVPAAVAFVAMIGVGSIAFRSMVCWLKSELLDPNK